MFCSLLILSPLDVRSEQCINTFHTPFYLYRFLDLYLHFSFHINMISSLILLCSKSLHMSCPSLLYNSNFDVFLLVSIFFPLYCHVSAQFRGCFPLICFHPGAHPVLSCGAPSAPGPAAKPPTAAHPPAPSGSQ